MTTKTKYRILAVIICVVVYIIYLAIAMSLGWKHGGGVLILAILVGVVSWVLKTAGEMADKTDAQKKALDQDNALKGEESAPLLEPTSEEDETPPSLLEEPIVDANINEGIDVTSLPGITPAIPLELNGILKALFILWMLVAGIKSIIQFASNVEGSYSIGAFDLAFTFLGIAGIAGMYAKKRWGLFVAGVFFVLQFIFCLIIGRTDSSFYEEAFKVVIRVIVICGMLCIRKDGHSAWEAIWNNGALNPPTCYSAEDEPKTEPHGDDLPPIPESEEKKVEVLTSVVDTSGCMAEETAPSCNVASSKPIEKKDCILKKYKWIYLLTALLLVLIAIGVFFLVRSIKEQKIILEKQQKFNELVSKGIEAHSNDLDELAMKYLNEAQSIDSSNWELYYYRGKITLENKEIVLSRDLLSNAYNLNSEKTDGLLGEISIAYADLLYDYSTVLRKIVDFNTSKVIAQEYYSLYPNDSKAYHLMVYAEGDANNLVKARKWAQQMLEKFPNEADSYHCYARVLAWEQSYSTAIDYYKKCLEIDPKRSSTYNDMGVCYAHLGDNSKAEMCYKIAVAIDGNETAAGNLKKRKK